MGLWEHSGRDLDSYVRDLGFYASSYSAMLENAGQGYVYVSEVRYFRTEEQAVPQVPQRCQEIPVEQMSDGTLVGGGEPPPSRPGAG